jgi:hypothetical protein
MNSRFGVVGVTAVGMFGNEALWFILLSGATVTVRVGGIVTRSSERNVVPDMREHLCLTATFNHDIVDGGSRGAIPQDILGFADGLRPGTGSDENHVRNTQATRAN